MQAPALLNQNLCWRYLSSQAVASQVLWTEMSLTTVFGMGTGGTSLLSTPAALKNRIEILTDEVFRELKKTNHKRKSNRPISTCKLNMSPCLHFKPINLVVFKGSYSLYDGISNLGVGFTLRCFQRLSVPYIAAQPCHWHDNWCTRGTSIPVLSY